MTTVGRGEDEDWKRLWALVVESTGSDATLPPDGDRWMSMIDALDDAGALAYLEEHDSGVELVDALAALPPVLTAAVDLESVADMPGDLTSAIVLADGLLAPHGLRIVYFAEDADARPLVVVPVAHADEIVSLSARLGHEARVFEA